MMKENDELLKRKKSEEEEPQFGLQPQNTYMSMMDLKMPNEYAPEDIISFYQIQSNFLKDKSYNQSKFCF